jgi:16S rRNA (adenine1518-N6/adenine1519-N6)-dimethyltransferase
MKSKKIKYPSSSGIPLQKKHGQYFLRDAHITADMLAAVDVKDASVFEIGCGDGFLTRAILAQKPKQLFVFEIDPSWATHVSNTYANARLTMHVTDFLKVGHEILSTDTRWIVLSNLPYHVTFPILHKIKEFGDLVPAGVFMMQEEVAQKLIQTRGRGYGYVALFFQYYFEWKLLSKVAPTCFYPQPKVFSRLISFVRKKDVPEIRHEKEFWQFIRLCFAQPRRTLRNNLAQTHIPLGTFSEDFLNLRSQQLSMADFLKVWEVVWPHFTGEIEIGSH